MNLKPATKTKCCCNCVHDRRIESDRGITCQCDIDGSYIGYIQCFEARCDKWEEDPWQKGETK